MEQEKVKQIEARLREMMAAADTQSQKDDEPAVSKQRGVRVIRRRKGAPDKQIM